MKRVMCRKLVQLVKNSEAGILLTSYDQLRLQRSELLAVNWGYAILDEGHKIRNPDAEVSPNSQQADIVIIPPHHMLTVPLVCPWHCRILIRDFAAQRPVVADMNVLPVCVCSSLQMAAADKSRREQDCRSVYLPQQDFIR